MNPKRLSGLSSNSKQPWKLPLPQYIEKLYLERFEKESPDVVRTIEQTAAEHVAKREARKAAKEAERTNNDGEQ